MTTEVEKTAAKYKLRGMVGKKKSQALIDKLTAKANAKTANEEVATNAVAGGAVAGLGVGSMGEPPVKKKLKTFKRFTAEATMGIGAVGRGSWSGPENAANRKKLADDFEQATYRKGKKFQPPGHKNNAGHGHHWMSHKGREYHWSGEGTEIATGKKSYQYSHTSEDGRSEHRAWVNQDGKITED